MRVHSLILKTVSSNYFMLYFCIVYFCIVSIITPDFASASNLQNIFSNFLPLLIVAIGQTLVMITGGIDLSVSSIIGLTSIAGAMVMNGDTGFLAGSAMAFPIGVLFMLFIGGVSGWFNGISVSLFGMTPFIATLISMMFIKGFAIWLSLSKNIYNLPESFVMLGYGHAAGVPYSFLITILITVCAHLLLTKTLLGYWFYSTGLNPKSSFIAGVPVRFTTCMAYILCGVCAAMASCFYTARLETGSPVLGDRLLLDIIGAVVIGGTSLFGGKGKIVWTVFGVLFITLLSNSLDMMGLSYFTIMIVKGFVILTAAGFDIIRGK